MKIITAATLILSLASLPVYASGEHAGGHGGDQHAFTVGKPGDPKKVKRTIEIQTRDNMRYHPASITVKRGETIKLVVKNVGKIEHELVLGDAKSLKEHAELMRKFPDMEHADPNMVRVKPGESGELIWQFTKSGKVDFACLIPGHFEAGMVGKVRVKKT